MFGIQLYIKTETIKRPLVQTDLRSTLISLYNSFCFLSRKNVIKLWPIIYNDFWEEYHYFVFDHQLYKPKRSTPVPFIKWLCFTCVTLSSVQKVYVDIIHTIFLHIPLIFIFLHREMLSLTRGPSLLVINTIHSSNTVVIPSTTFFAETTASSKIAT